MIAEVIGIDDVISVTPTLDTNAYTTGDRFGAIQTLTNVFRKIHRSLDPVTATTSDFQPKSGKVILQSVFILDKAKQSVPFDILFFDRLPTVASADNAAIDISDTEMEKCIGSVTIDSDYVALASNSVTTLRPPVSLLLKQSASATDNNLYAVVIIRASGTFAASDVTFKYGFFQD